MLEKSAPNYIKRIWNQLVETNLYVYELLSVNRSPVLVWNIQFGNLKSERSIIKPQANLQREWYS